jgi:hypothetical protein
VFNDGDLGDGQDKYWISRIQGLDGPVMRVPVDPVPFGDGSLVHSSWKGGRTPVFDGWLLIESSSSQADCQELRNDLVADLRDAFESIIAPSTGTLSWTPAGQAAETLEVSLGVGSWSIDYSDDYRMATFNFQLISAAAEPS